MGNVLAGDLAGRPETTTFFFLVGKTRSPHNLYCLTIQFYFIYFFFVLPLVHFPNQIQFGVYMRDFLRSVPASVRLDLLEGYGRWRGEARTRARQGREEEGR